MAIVENIKQCSICQGTVDKHEHCFLCRDCGALGDFTTGIMTDCSLKSHSPKELNIDEKSN